MSTKIELLGIALTRYLKANKETKTKILDELVQHTQMHRKSLCRAFKRLQFRDLQTKPTKRGRKEVYGPGVTVALKEVWEISSELCAERLQPMIGEYVRILQRDKMWSHNKETTRLLLLMSLGTCKNRISKFRRIKRKQRHNTTKPSHIKILIPVRHGPWKNPEPGFGEIDTVAHCGHTLAGDFAYTVNFTDITTTWWSAAAQLNKGQKATLESIEAMRDRIPFGLKGLDPDTGSEFVNWHLKGWADKEQIELSRSRPYHKNDNAHIEQKNDSIVRNFLGHGRIDASGQIKLMNQLYGGPLYLYVNFFQSSQKLVKKEKIGSRYVRKHDRAKTPYHRVLADKRIKSEVKAELAKLYETLNPLLLKQEIDTLIKRIWARLDSAKRAAGRKNGHGNTKF